MKLISCTNCGAKKIGPKNDKHPNGAPVVCGRFTGGKFPMVVKCHRCTNAMKFGVLDFARLPELSAQELKGLGY